MFINSRINIISGELWKTVKELKAFDGRYHCNSCVKSYRHAEGLYTHKKYECGKDPQFHCPHCAYKARYKSGLKQHIITKHFNLPLQVLNREESN